MTQRTLIAGDAIVSASGSKSMRRALVDVSRDLNHLLGYDASAVMAWNNECTALLSANPAVASGFADFRDSRVALVNNLGTLSNGSQTAPEYPETSRNSP